MHKIMFVCYGNICRSPMAEFLLKDMVARRGKLGEFQICSAATSNEEIGNGVHFGTREKLAQFGISTAGKHAVQLTRGDYAKYDFILGMESMNVRDILRIVGGDPDGKVRRLLDFSDKPRDIADPWFTHNFDKTYDDISEGCAALLKFLGED